MGERLRSRTNAAEEGPRVTPEVLKRGERKAPPFTFFDRGAGADGCYRAQITLLNGKRCRILLKKADGLVVRNPGDVSAAMAMQCRKLIDDRRLDPESDCARFYLGRAAEIISMPLPQRAPPPHAEFSRKTRQSPASGWHGMDVMSMEVDYKLIAALTPDGSAAKIAVIPLSAAAKADLRTGDYVLAVGQSGAMVSLRDFEGLGLKVGAGILVHWHRPGHHKAGEFAVKALTLRKRFGANRKKPPWWQSRPKGELGRVVKQGADRAAFVGQIAAHPHIPEMAFRLLARMASHYDGKNGIFASYGTLAKDLGSKRRATAVENAHCLEWLGLLEIQLGKGRPARTKTNRPCGGFSNRFVLHWPAVWPIEEKT